MNSVVYKYELRQTADQLVAMPAPATIISAAIVSDWIVVYALVQPYHPKPLAIKRRVFIVPTGQEVPPEAMRFIGTVVMHQNGTDFVFHIWTDHPGPG